MKHVMVDLETMGRGPGCPILSIGAVEFDHTGLGREFYEVAHMPTQIILGLQVDPDTERWWGEQTVKARKVLTEAHQPNQTSLPLVLENFAAWLPKDACVWGNGADFDNSILAYAYKQCGMASPWAFWNSRCFRTLKSFSDVRTPRIGTHHNALDDAKTQALNAIAIVSALGMSL